MNKNESKISELLKKHEMSESDNLHLLSLIRKELETLGKAETKYNDLKFFCDWVLHNEIDRSFSGSKFVSELHNCINEIKSIPNNDYIIQRTCETLLVSLREQLHAFLKERTLQTNVIDNSRKWRSFLRNLLENIENTPVVLLNKHETDLKMNPLKPGMWCNEISIFKASVEDILIRSNEPIDLQHLEEKNRKQMYWLQMNTNINTKIWIPLITVF
jgi:hypothetical protein